MERNRKHVFRVDVVQGLYSHSSQGLYSHSSQGLYSLSLHRPLPLRNKQISPLLREERRALEIGGGRRGRGGGRAGPHQVREQRRALDGRLVDQNLCSHPRARAASRKVVLVCQRFGRCVGPLFRPRGLAQPRRCSSGRRPGTVLVLDYRALTRQPLRKYGRSQYHHPSAARNANDEGLQTAAGRGDGEAGTGR